MKTVTSCKVTAVEEVSPNFPAHLMNFTDGQRGIFIGTRSAWNIPGDFPVKEALVWMSAARTPRGNKKPGLQPPYCLGERKEWRRENTLCNHSDHFQKKNNRHKSKVFLKCQNRGQVGKFHASVPAKMEIWIPNGKCLTLEMSLW